jgi:hypothetical protein
MVRWATHDARIGAAGQKLVNTRATATPFALRTARAFAGAIGRATLVPFGTNVALGATLVPARSARGTTLAPFQALAITANTRPIAAGGAGLARVASAAPAFLTFATRYVAFGGRLAHVVATLIFRGAAITAC